MRNKLAFSIILILLTITTLGLFSCASQTETSSENMPVVQPVSQSPMLTIAEVVTKVRPAVVSINVEITAYDFFNRPVKEEGAGSGWIIDSDGYIVTNNHVVQDADNVTITLSDGRIFQAKMVNTDPLTDLAVVKIDVQDLPVLAIGNSARLNVGDGVIAIGNALGQGISATSGIVSVVDVSLDASPGQTLLGLIQTDAAINPGNSGGPLVNMAGEVIGINSIKVSQVGVEGMGYAISMNEADPIINTLIDKGYIVRPWTGVGISEINEFVANIYNLPVNKGVFITSIVDGSPADKAGLKEGDIITRIDDKEITTSVGFFKVINSYEVGQKVNVTYWQGDNQDTTEVTLAETPPMQY